MSDFQEAMDEIRRANDLLDVIATLRRQNAALQEDAERARWCEDNYANVFWSVSGQYWFCEVPRSPKAFTQYFREATRNAAIDAAMRGGK